jgi:hypothetical protein
MAKRIGMEDEIEGSKERLFESREIQAMRLWMQQTKCRARLPDSKFSSLDGGTEPGIQRQTFNLCVSSCHMPLNFSPKRLKMSTRHKKSDHDAETDAAVFLSLFGWDTRALECIS